MSTALLLVDIQNDYFPGGAMALVGSVEAGDQASKLLEAYRRKGLPVIHMQHISKRPGATFFLPDTKGVEIRECVSPREGETIIRKHFPNSFRDTSLPAHLRDNKITRLVIAGMMTHMCIDTTTRAAADLGFECLLAHDACATKSLSFGGVTIPAETVHASFLASLNGAFAKVQAADDLCAAL
jgi:nicotinamidase-related amidase